jgi:hypothetical protein
LDINEIPNEEKTALFINLHNLLLVHAIISNGYPSFVKRLNFGKKNVYNIGGFNISILELEHAIIRGFSWSGFSLFGTLFLPKYRTDDKRYNFILQKDPRINFALNCGSSHSPLIRVYSNNATSLNLELDYATYYYLKEHVQLTYNDTTQSQESGSFRNLNELSESSAEMRQNTPVTMLLPKIMEW